MGCLNNDRTVMSRPYAWRPLGLLPILKTSALTVDNVAWQRHRRLDLYHRCMDPVIAEINELCAEDKYFRFADKKVRQGRCFWHLLSMDGLEIAATTMCNTDNCPVCECPKDELDRTDFLYPLRDSATVKARVEAAARRRQRCWNRMEPSSATAKNGYGGRSYVYLYVMV